MDNSTWVDLNSLAFSLNYHRFFVLQQIMIFIYEMKQNVKIISEP